MSNTTTTITTNQPTVDVWVEEQIKTFPKSSTLGEILTELKLGSKRVIFIHGGKSSTKQELRSLLLYRDSLKVADAYDMHDLIDLVQKYPSMDHHKGKKTPSESSDPNPLSDFRVEFSEFRKYFMESQKRHDELMGLTVSQLKPPQHFNMAAEDEEEEDEEEEEEGDNGAGEPASEEEGDNGAGEPAKEEEGENERIEATIEFEGKTKILSIPAGMDYPDFCRAAIKKFRLNSSGVEVKSLYFTRGGRIIRKIGGASFVCQMGLRLQGGVKKSCTKVSKKSKTTPIYQNLDQDEMDCDDDTFFKGIMKMRTINIDTWLESLSVESLEKLDEEAQKAYKNHSLTSETFLNRMVEKIVEHEKLEELESRIGLAKEHLKILMNTSMKSYPKKLDKAISEIHVLKRERLESQRVREEMNQMRQLMQQRDLEIAQMKQMLQQQQRSQPSNSFPPQS